MIKIQNPLPLGGIEPKISRIGSEDVTTGLERQFIYMLLIKIYSFPIFFDIEYFLISKNY